MLLVRVSQYSNANVPVNPPQKALLNYIVRVIATIVTASNKDVFDAFKASLIDQLLSSSLSFPTILWELQFPSIRKVVWATSYRAFVGKIGTKAKVDSLLDSLSEQRAVVRPANEPWLCLRCQKFQIRAYAYKGMHACFSRANIKSGVEGRDWRR